MDRTVDMAYFQVRLFVINVASFTAREHFIQIANTEGLRGNAKQALRKAQSVRHHFFIKNTLKKCLLTALISYLKTKMK